MSSLATIKQDLLQSRKDRDAIKTSLLTTLYNDAAMIGLNDNKRESTDAEVVAVIKKYIATCTSNLELYQEGENRSKCTRELEILNSLLPKQLTEEELTQIITTLLTTVPAPETDKDKGKVIGAVMGKLKQTHAGLYDGAQAKLIIESLIKPI